MQKIWISGASGQLGRSLNRVVDKMEYEIFDTDLDTLDITDIDSVFSFGEINRPDVIINCSAITDVAACEKDPKMAYKVNALGARNLSIVAMKVGAKMVQISTDDVFDGNTNTPYNEFDETNPTTVYGKSKLAGERYVKEFTNKHFIIRSTWVYGDGDNFVSRLLSKAEKGEALAIASDQFGSPTNADELASFILHIIKTSEYGTYHATGKGSCSRYEFAIEILKLKGMKAEVKAVPASESDFSSERPNYAVLDNFIMSIIDVYDFQDWKEKLTEYILGGKN